MWKNFIRFMWFKCNVMQLALNELFLGKIDAKNESIDGSENQQRFLDGFVVPDNMDLSKFISGDRYYIVGLKGTGKTALLKYIQLKVEQKVKAQTAFVLFKSDFTLDDKAGFTRAATCIIDKSQSSGRHDFEDVWLWYIHRQLVDIITERGLVGSVFADNPDWERYKACVLAPKLGDKNAGIWSLLPTLKKGNIEIGGDIAGLKGSIGLDFEWADRSQTSVKFSAIVRQVNQLFAKLLPGNVNVTPIYLFFDELELSYENAKQYNTDICLIRDVIVAINKINSLAREKRFPIHVITSIRSEVLTAIQMSGKEINKNIGDFGLILKWPQRGDDSRHHPLINIITKKVVASYKMKAQDISEDDVWQWYFPSMINNKSIYEFILNKTWYRPRDIVRLLSLAQNHSPMSLTFSQSILEAINKDYSRECWLEQIEELRTLYRETELQGIKEVLVAIKCPFSFVDFTARCEAKSKLYNSVKELLKKQQIGDILSNLYRVGIIGNTGQKMRFSFRGDDELVLEKAMTIHQALWSFLSVERKVETDRGSY